MTPGMMPVVASTIGIAVVPPVIVVLYPRIACPMQCLKILAR
jgi:hypothetical protein